jgi:hypothetical protein
MALLCSLAGQASSATDDVEPSAAVPRFEAQLLMRHPAREAGQGAAGDGEHFFAIVNSAIGKYRRTDGERVAGWSLPRGGPVRHINSCLLESARLLCANSNFPEVPMASSVEIFDSDTMTHVATHSLGLTDGSLVWFDRFRGAWLAGFAHYDGTGGLPDKGHRATRIVTLDEHWRETGGWMLPDSVLERLAPHSASGGAIGNDGLLYVMGHDRPEMYVLDFPAIGPKLEHVATIDIEAHGQAFGWQAGTEERLLWAINRPTREVRLFRIPGISDSN